MIYTVSLNPAIDYIMRLPGDLNIGKTNRSDSEEICFGGKGINVSFILKEIGLENVALGFVAGFTGKALIDGIGNMGIKNDFIWLPKGDTRINVKLKASDGINTISETEINGQGPCISEKSINELLEKISSIKEGDTIVLSGSVPSSLPDDVYDRILMVLEGKNIKKVVDATGKLLLKTLKYRPFLVKPNISELGELFGVSICSNEEIITYAKKLQEMGVKNVLVSLGGDGAILVPENGQAEQVDVVPGTVINTVGAGDSMVAGFIAGMERYDDPHEGLLLGLACGCATSFSLGLATKQEIFKIFSTISKKDF